MSSSAQKTPQPERVFDFSTISETIDGLLINVHRDFKRHIEARDVPTARGFLLMRIAALFARQLYDSIRFLCADVESPGPRPEYVFAVPSIVRTMQEILFTIMYVNEDFPARADEFHKAGWREHNEERGKYCNEYSKMPEWRPFLNKFKQSVQMGIQHLQLSPEESKQPQSIDYFPIGQRLLDAMGKSNQSFAKWLDKWFYDETSAIAHFTPLGVMKIAGYLIRDMTPEADRKMIEEESMRKFKGFYYMMATIVVMSIASELEHQLHLNNRGQIVKVWEKIRIDFPDAEEVCSRRYDELLSMKAKS
ncbi:MAG TPA: hypothetical protein VGH51_21640 [Candidatus Angelobacter sp.]|jgi:hypothetical protein